jgi:hypothetical protein
MPPTRGKQARQALGRTERRRPVALVANLGTEPFCHVCPASLLARIVAADELFHTLRDRQPLVVAAALLLIVRLITFDGGR